MMKGGNVGKQIIKISEWRKWQQRQDRRLSITALKPRPYEDTARLILIV